MINVRNAWHKARQNVIASDEDDMRFFGTRSGAEAKQASESGDSYWRLHRPELLPKRSFGVRKLTVLAVALAGAAMIGALFALQGGDENVATSGAILPKEPPQPAPLEMASPEEQSIDFGQAPLDKQAPPDSSTPGGYDAAAAGAAQPPAGLSSETTMAATINTPVAAPAIAAPPPTGPQFPDPQTVRAGSLGPDGTPIATRTSSAATDLGMAAQASDAARPPAKPAPTAQLETGAIAQPKHDSPAKRPKKASAHGVVARTETTSPSAATEAPNRPVQLGAPAKPRKAAKATAKAPQAAAEPQPDPQAQADPLLAPQAQADPLVAPQAATEPQADPQAAAGLQGAPPATRRPAGR
jgi:hypothetical protein